MTFIERLGKVLAHHRVKQGYTQAELGQVLGLTQAQVSRSERGYAPRIETLVAIADFYGVALAEIIDEAEHWGEDQ